jgi:hypothetical protein
MSQNTIVPFGKYKGKDLLYIIENNPRYLLWLNSIELKGDLSVAVPALIETDYFNEALAEYLDLEMLCDHGCTESDLY